jgi:hypothetical protein
MPLVVIWREPSGKHQIRYTPEGWSFCEGAIEHGAPDRGIRSEQSRADQQHAFGGQWSEHDQGAHRDTAQEPLHQQSSQGVSNHDGRFDALFQYAQDVGGVVPQDRFVEAFSAVTFSMPAQADRCGRPAPLRQDAKETLPDPGSGKRAVNAKDRRRATWFCGANFKHFERRDAAPRCEEARRYDAVRKHDDLDRVRACIAHQVFPKR